MPTKLCNDCGMEKDLERGFSKRSISKDGHQSKCKECKKNIDAIYRENNADKLKEKRATYYINNTDRVKEIVATYRKNNPDKIKEKDATYRKNNPDKINKQKALYMKNNPDKMAEKSRRRRMRKAGIPGTHSTAQWEEMKKAYNYTCPMCGRSEPEIKLTEDHKIPISRPDLYSTDDISNIQPLCVSCNSRKGDRV